MDARRTSAGRQEMTESINYNSPGSTNHLKRSPAGSTLTSSDKSQAVRQEKSQSKDDQVTLTYNSETTATYNHSMSLDGTVSDGYDLLRGLVLNMFKEQGLDYKIQADETEIDINTVTPEEAQELVSEEGYFGVEKTSERIFEFAVGIAGGDPARIDAVREGVEKGFQEAEGAFGGQLPDISYQTYDAVMKKLDDWAGIDPSKQS